MSIGLAILGRGTGVVGSDSSRVESDGRTRSDFDKTFALEDWLIGVNVGLLEISGVTIGEHVRNALGLKPRTLVQSADKLGCYLKASLLAMPSDEVAFVHRKIQLLLVGHTRMKKGELAIRAVSLSPAAADIVIAEQGFDRWAHIGDDSARETVEMGLRRNANRIGDMTGQQLTALVREQIGRGIDSTGRHPIHASISACAGTPRTRLIRG